MDIKSDLRKNYLRCSNEAMGVNLDKKNILKNKKNSTYTYTEHNILILILILLCTTALVMIKTPTTFAIAMFLLIIAFLHVVVFLGLFIADYLFRKNKLVNIIRIDEEGVTDKSFYGMKITFSWNKILAVVKRSNTVVILTDTPIFFYFPKSKAKAVITEIKKYKEDILIIK